MDCSIHLPKTSPDVSTMQAASKPCSASWLLGSAFPSTSSFLELLPEEKALAFLRGDALSLAKEDELGINTKSPQECSTRCPQWGFRRPLQRQFQFQHRCESLQLPFLNQAL